MEALVRFHAFKNDHIRFRREIGGCFALTGIYARSIDAAAVGLSIGKVPARKNRFGSKFFHAKAVLFFRAREFSGKYEFRISLHGGRVSGVQSGRLGKREIAIVDFSKFVVCHSGNFGKLRKNGIRSVLKRVRRFANGNGLLVLSSGA